MFGLVMLRFFKGYYSIPDVPRSMKEIVRNQKFEHVFPQTFSSCTNNAGGGMDPESGAFTAPLNGAYLFAATVCSHDMKKVLIAVRRNGAEIASLYDQVRGEN